jgi:hypothetical protein
MEEHIETEQNKRFIKKFDFEKHGFYSVMPYINTQVGFGCKRKLNIRDKKNVTGIGISIFDKTYNEPGSKKALFVTATYGEELADGIRVRSKQNFSEPVDLEFRDEFFYDIDTEKIFKENKEIPGDELLLEVYNKHIKTTKPIRGLVLRIRLRFWRKWLPWIPKQISNVFHYILLLISGDRYTYEFLFQEEKLNGEIISSRMEGRVGRNVNPHGKEVDREATKIEFFGISVPHWPIVFYSILHLCLWILANHFNFHMAGIKEFLDNNFLVVLYAIVSFWLIETIFPFILKKLVKYLSTLSFISLTKAVRV